MSKPRKKLYLVIALWDGQRWAQSYWADSPQEAERLAMSSDDDAATGKCGEFIIAAVLHGKEVVL